VAGLGPRRPRALPGHPRQASRQSATGAVGAETGCRRRGRHGLGGVRHPGRQPPPRRRHGHAEGASGGAGRKESPGARATEGLEQRGGAA
jgi:hypothetical protein